MAVGEKDLSIAAKMLDFYALRHKLIAHNVANADVPGFHQKTVSFEKELLEAIESRDPRRIEEVKFKVRTSQKAGVDRDVEIARMAKNEVLFNAFAQITSLRFRMYRAAISSR